MADFDARPVLARGDGAEALGDDDGELTLRPGA